MDGLAKEIHSMGLKLGLYGDAGTLTCAGYPGSYSYEQKDADTLAAWGVDYWKFDNCLTEQPYTNKGIKSPQYYPTMRDALLKTKAPIFFSICQWGRDEVWTWAGKVGNSWRMSPDIQNNWASVASIAAKAASIYQYSAPGGFNDLDMMVCSWGLTYPRRIISATELIQEQELGNGRLTEAEERAHFGLWAIMKSPIIMGTDMSKLKPSTLAIIKNKVFQ
jgi:alpha-galactosidase